MATKLAAVSALAVVKPRTCSVTVFTLVTVGTREVAVSVPVKHVKVMELESMP